MIFNYIRIMFRLVLPMLRLNKQRKIVELVTALLLYRHPPKPSFSFISPQVFIRHDVPIELPRCPAQSFIHDPPKCSSLELVEGTSKACRIVNRP